jgi:hypothetical protein
MKPRYQNRWFTIMAQPTRFRQLVLWLRGLACIADGLILLGSFGFIIPGLNLGVARWQADRELDQLKKWHANLKKFNHDLR